MFRKRIRNLLTLSTLFIASCVPGQIKSSETETPTASGTLTLPASDFLDVRVVSYVKGDETEGRGPNEKIMYGIPFEATLRCLTPDGENAGETVLYGITSNTGEVGYSFLVGCAKGSVPQISVRNLLPIVDTPKYEELCAREMVVLKVVSEGSITRVSGESVYGSCQSLASGGKERRGY